MSTWAIIPARSGSKRLMHKNIKLLNGQPLLAYSIQAAQQAKHVDRIFVSTDLQEYASIANKYGAESPFLRPKPLASDSASTVDVILHFLEKMQDTCDLPEWTLILQPTSPLRTAKHIDDALSLLQAQQVDAVVSVKEVEEHPYTMKLIRNNRLIPFIKDEFLPTRRQDYPRIYKLNGAIYAFKTKPFLEQRTLNLKVVLPYVMEQMESIDIDTAFDFYLTETILQGNYNHWSSTEEEE